MSDDAIIALLEQRDETALLFIEQQYGSAGRHIAAKIVGSDEDAQEVFQDTLLRIWNAIPPEHPQNLFAYLCTVLRRLSYNKREKIIAEKRGGGQQALALDELDEVTAGSQDVENIVSERLLQEAVNQFLAGLKPEAQAIFIQRYGNLRSVAFIADAYDISESKVKVSLMRTRKKLHSFLKKEGLL